MRFLLRLSLELRTPLAEILRWPEWQVEAYATFMAREPSREQRIEILLAKIACRVFNVTRAAGASALESRDFLLQQDLWAPEGAAPLDSDEMKLMAVLDRAASASPM